jgi:CheY-like chemotaxis protein
VLVVEDNAVKQKVTLHQLARLPYDLAITADVVTSGRQRSIDAGMNDYLSKPIELDDLAGVLLRWLRVAPVKDREPAGIVLH